MLFMTPMHSKLARTALGLGIRDVAQATGLGGTTINRFEKGGDIKVSKLQTLKDFYEAGGIQFIDTDEHGGAGVRLE